MSYAHLQSAWAEWLIDSLASCGVRRAVVSPGSRSTPLALAVRRAESEGRLEAVVLADERVAGFFALGQARVTGVPSLLICTSGTAASHYFPALIEASLSGIPLIVLTADRPPELQARGSNQTIRQEDLFGRWTRESLDLGMPDPDPRACEGLPRSAARIVHAALQPDPGPVHLNARFRKPLEVDSADPPELVKLRARVTASVDAGLPGPHRQRAEPDPGELDELATRIRRARRGILLAGPAPVTGGISHGALRSFLEKSGFVLAPEATSQLRFGSGVPRDFLFDAFEPLLSRPGASRSLEPDFILQLGGAPTGRGVGALLSSISAPERVAIAHRGYPEAFNRATDVWITDPNAVMQGLIERLDGIAPESDWAHRARTESARVWQRLDDLLAQAPGFPEPVAVRAAIESVPAGGLLALGNSLPVREADMFCPATERSIAVLSQRGASGIDGGISWAAGAVDASGFPGLLLLGDVSFQHDVGGLAAARKLDSPLAIVVLCNGGGRLFDLLPIRVALREDERSFERFFHTAPDLDPSVAAAAFDVPGVSVWSGSELREAIAEALNRPSATVIAARLEGPPAAHWVEELRRIAADGSRE